MLYCEGRIFAKKSLSFIMIKKKGSKGDGSLRM